MNTFIETSPESITLYYREGSSDKVYQVSLEPTGELFTVNFAFGRRGFTLNTGTKTADPVDYPAAKRIYAKLVGEKKAKGYSEGPDGSPYQHSQKAERFTGLLPQLLNPVDEPEVDRLISDPAWCLQPKYDGRRLLLQKTGREVVGINRKGLIVGLPECLVHAALLLPGDYLLDGEAVGLVYYAFDLLEINGLDGRPLPLRRRLQGLLKHLSPNAHPYIVGAQTAWSTEEKKALLASLRRANKEGVVMKEIHTDYKPGRRNTGGPALKHKFYATLSAVVAQINPQRSVEIRLLGKDGWKPAGNVTIPANHPVPQVGQVAEVKYLYAFPESGVLFQPVYLGARSDVDQADCVVGQLKYKSSEIEEEA